MPHYYCVTKSYFFQAGDANSQFCQVKLRQQHRRHSPRSTPTEIGAQRGRRTVPGAAPPRDAGACRRRAGHDGDESDPLVSASGTFVVFTEEQRDSAAGKNR